MQIGFLVVMISLCFLRNHLHFTSVRLAHIFSVVTNFFLYSTESIKYSLDFLVTHALHKHVYYQILAVCLLYEMGKGKSSRWYPYFLHLPRSYDVMASFSECEKQALQVQFPISSFVAPLLFLVCWVMFNVTD